MRTITSRVRHLERGTSLVRESALEQIVREALRALSDDDLSAIKELLHRDVTSPWSTPEEKAAAEHYQVAAAAANAKNRRPAEVESGRR